MINNIKVYTDDLPEDHNLQGDLAVDTEAMGLYYRRDRLCLVQICDAKNQICMVKFNKNFKAPTLKNYFLITNELSYVIMQDLILR